MIGAHPDDCDIKGGGTAALFAAMGYAVKFVAVTNGDAGHQTMGGGPLAKRRYEEAQESARRLGIAAYHILPNHDGELLPSLSVRLEIIREIREWNADVVLSPRPNDYHPDHRYTGALVQDAAAMVRDYTKWDDFPWSLTHFAESAVRAYQVSMTPPMAPVVLVLDGGLQEHPISKDERLPVPRLTMPTAPAGERGAVEEAAKMLVAADNPVFVVDRRQGTNGEERSGAASREQP